MSEDKLKIYRSAEGKLPESYKLWPLYGAGFENLGKDGEAIEVPLPEPGPDELLVRHDSCSVCFSDIKIIKQGQEHVRIFKDMKTDPVVMGHEVSLTVVKVGENLTGQYKPGDRFTIQADIYSEGVNYAYGYMIQGGYSQYGIVDQRVLNGDDGNYLLPVEEKTGYSEAALNEPWACVIAAYELGYRTTLKEGGVLWVIGAGDERLFEVGAGYKPGKLILTDVPPVVDDWLMDNAGDAEVIIKNGLKPEEYADAIAEIAPDGVDDVVVLGNNPEIVEKASATMGMYGVCCIMSDRPMPGDVQVDVGRIHYSRWTFVGDTGTDIAKAYSKRVIKGSEIEKGDKALFVGAGGPMGRMHVQRALQIEDGPSVVVASDISNLRLGDLADTFRPDAEAKGIEFIAVNPVEGKDEYNAVMERFTANDDGFDYVVILAPIPAVISEASDYLADSGVMNIFAGVQRGRTAAIDLTDVYMGTQRFIGHTASTIDDMNLMIEKTETGQLSPNRAVAAIGSIEATYDGLKAAAEQTYPGKAVIYNHIKPFPLTPLPELKEKLPTVYAKLRNGREWTVEAEEEFLRLMLP